MTSIHDRVWMVTQDGRAIKHGLTKPEAERHADYLARGYESHAASSKRRVAEFDVRLDTNLVAESEANFKWLRENR